jgi:ankyrin repeat protein
MIATLFCGMQWVAERLRIEDASALVDCRLRIAGTTALMVAAGAGYTDANRGTEPQALDAVKLCVSLGLDVNAVTDKGETTLHGAARRGANTIIQYLADNGGKMNAANKTGLTAYDLAMGKGGGSAGRQPPKEVTAALIQKLGGTAGVEVTQVAKAE